MDGTVICYLGTDDNKIYEIDLIRIIGGANDPNSKIIYDTDFKFERIQISDSSRNFIFGISGNKIVVQDLKTQNNPNKSSIKLSGSRSNPHWLTSLQYHPNVAVSEYGTNYLEIFKVNLDYSMSSSFSAALSGFGRID